MGDSIYVIKPDTFFSNIAQDSIARNNINKEQNINTQQEQKKPSELYNAIEHWNTGDSLAKAEWKQWALSDFEGFKEYYKQYKTLIKNLNIDKLYSAKAKPNRIAAYGSKTDIGKDLFQSLLKVGFSEVQALAILANSYHETMGWSKMNQLNNGPARGLLQMEEAARQQYANFREDNNLEENTDALAQYIASLFLNGKSIPTTYYDNSGNGEAYTTAQALEDWNSGDLDKTVKAFMYSYERPGTPMLDKRLGVAKLLSDNKHLFYKEGGNVKRNNTSKRDAPTTVKKPFEDWYKTVPTDRNDTIKYNLRRAYELAPIDELETWRTSTFEDLKSGKNHLRSVYFNPDTGIYEFVKSKDHKSLQSELDWFYSDDPEAIEFRNNYYLDTSNDFYKYIPKKKALGGSIKRNDTKSTFFAKDGLPGGMQFMYQQPSSTSVQSQSGVQPVEYYDKNIVQSAKALGLTVEEYLKLIEKSNQPGVVYEDSGNDGVNYYRSRTATDPRAREAAAVERQRQDQVQEQQRQEAGKAVNLLFSLGMPSTYVGLTTGTMDLATGEGKNTTGGKIWGNTRLVQDVAVPIAGLSVYKGARQIPRLSKNLYYKQISPRIGFTRTFNKDLNETVAEVLQNAMAPVQINKYGTVKYYGPTMGKTTAVKTNPRLVDFDDIVREEIQQLANKKGISVRELKTKSDIEYTQLLENAVSKWQANPANKDKTLLISNSVLSNKPIFDNTPVIPSKNQFIARQVARGESDPTFAAQYYDDLLKRNPQLKIDDRFVSEIESGTRSAKISESELAGIPRGGRAPYTREENIAFRNQINEFANKYGYEPIGEEVTDPDVLERYARAMISKHNSFYRGVHMPYNEDDIAIIHKALGVSPTEEQVLQYVATHPRSNQDVMFISPRSNAGIYGSNGKTAIISRPYKLGSDRTKWFTEGDYPIYQAPGLKQYQLPENAIVDPWSTPNFPEKIPSISGGYAYYNYDPDDKEFYDLVKYLYEVRPFDAPNELTTRSPMIFRGWANWELPDLSRNYGRHPWQEIVFKKQGGKLNYLNYLNLFKKQI